MARSFVSGSSQSMTLTSLPFDAGTSPFTASMWIQFTSALPGFAHFVQFIDGGSFPIYFGILSVGAMEFYKRSTGPSPVDCYRDTDSVITAGVLYHLLVMNDGSTTGTEWKVYLNGSEVTYSASGTGAGSCQSTSGQAMRVATDGGGGFCSLDK